MTSWGSEAKVWYVDPAGSGSTPTIQSAVDSCAASGDNILLAAGIYHEGGIVIDGKSILIDQYNGQAYLISPSAGSGTCFTIRNSPSCTLNSIVIRGFGTAVALQNSSGFVQFLTAKACTTGFSISGASSAPTVWFCCADSSGTGMEIQNGSVTLQNETIANCSTGVRFLGGSATLTRSIIYGCVTGVQCSGGSGVLSCNDFFLDGTNYGGCSSGTNDFYTDPKFCFAKSAVGPYWLHDTSPCYTKQNPCNAKIGMFTTMAGCTGAGVEPSTWGTIKNMYR